MTQSDFESRNNHNENNELQDEYSLVKHSVKHKRAERKIRKKRKKANSIKAFLRFVVLLLLIFLAYEFFKISPWYLPRDTFKNSKMQRIEIVNNSIIPTYVISDSLKEVKIPRLPIYMMSVKPIKKEIFKIPIIKRVYVRRYGFPARVQIIVEERVPIAVIKTDLKAKPAAIFTSDGLLIITKPYMNIPERNVLKILTSTANLSKNWSVKRFEEIEEIVKAVEAHSNEPVEYIDMTDPNDIYVKIKTIKLRLGTLDSTVFERIKRIHTILPQIRQMDSKIKYIDLRWDKVEYLKLNKSE